MNLNCKFLNENNCPLESQDWFARNFGKETYSLKEVFMMNPSPTFLLWIEEYFLEKIDDIEKKVLYDKLKVENSSNTKKSYQISSSNYVYNSFNILNSNIIRSSNSIIDSKSIYNCSEMKNCTFCEKSSNCIDSKFLNECRYCIDSFRLEECEDLKNSAFSYLCKNSEDLILSMGCEDSNSLFNCLSLKNCKDCMFCVGLKEKQYHIFNTPMNAATYRIIHDQIMMLWNQSHSANAVSCVNFYSFSLSAKTIFNFLPYSIRDYMKKQSYYNPILGQIFKMEGFENE